MSNKAAWLYSLWVSFVCLVFFAIYMSTGYTVGWMAFCALAVYFGLNGSAKQLPNFVCSVAAGLIWGQINLLFVGLLMNSMGFSYFAAVLVDVLIVTCITMGIHLTVLAKTYFNVLPFVFLCVALTFSGTPCLQIGAALFSGLIVAVISSIGGDIIFKKFPSV